MYVCRHILWIDLIVDDSDKEVDSFDQAINEALAKDIKCYDPTICHHGSLSMIYEIRRRLLAEAVARPSKRL
jgi:hypothetical protein